MCRLVSPIAFALIVILFATSSLAQLGFPKVRVRESDNSPNVDPVYEIVLPNGSIVSSGSQTATLGFLTASDVNSLAELQALLGDPTLEVGDRVIYDTTGDLTTKLGAAIASCGVDGTNEPNAGCRIVLGTGEFKQLTKFISPISTQSLSIVGQGKGHTGVGATPTWSLARTSIAWCPTSPASGDVAMQFNGNGFLRLKDFALRPSCGDVAATALNTADVAIQLRADNNYVYPDVMDEGITHAVIIEDVYVGGGLWAPLDTIAFDVFDSTGTKQSQLDFVNFSRVHAINVKTCWRQNSGQAVLNVVRDSECTINEGHSFGANAIGAHIESGTMQFSRTYFGGNGPWKAVWLDNNDAIVGVQSFNDNHFELAPSGAGQDDISGIVSTATGGLNPSPLFSITIAGNDFVNTAIAGDTGSHDTKMIDLVWDGPVQISQNSVALGGASGSRTSTFKIRRTSASGITKVNEWGNLGVNYVAPTWDIAGSVAVNREQWRHVLSADVTTSSSSTYTAANDLATALEANRNYLARCRLVVGSAAATTGLQLQVTGPASPTQVTIERISHDATPDRWVSLIANAFHTGSTDDGAISNCTGRCVDTLDLVIKNGANAGMVAFAIESEVNASSVTLYSGSSCEWSQF